MKQYRFEDDLNQKIVDGILKGYASYVRERAEKREQMIISGAYAWVKGNHIDHHTGLEVSDMEIEYNTARAGHTWGYLQFRHSEDGRNRIFIIRNAKYFNETEFDRAKTPKNTDAKRKTNYLLELAKANANVKFEDIVEPSDLEYEQMSIDLGSPNTDVSVQTAKSLSESVNEFHIVTYLTDETNAIREIRHVMPNPVNKKAYLVNDLSHFIGTSEVNMIDLDYSALSTNEDDAAEFTAFHYGVGLLEDQFGEGEKEASAEQNFDISLPKEENDEKLNE